MKFTKFEQDVINELEKRAGDVLYLKHIAPYFIKKSNLQISTYTQTAYVQVGDNMQRALSEYFQLVVFIKKIEESGNCFSIPYTPLEDNLATIGNADFQKYEQHTIADGDLLIQLFKYAGKKYVIVPLKAFDEKPLEPAPVAEQLRNDSKATANGDAPKSAVNNIVSTVILFLLFLFIGVMGYQSYVDSNNLKFQQEEIAEELEEHKLSIESLNSHLKAQLEENRNFHQAYQSEVKFINSSLEEQKTSLRSIRYWNRRQFKELEKLLVLVVKDTIN